MWTQTVHISQKLGKANFESVGMKAMAEARRPTNKAAREQKKLRTELEAQIKRAAAAYDVAATLPEDYSANLLNLCLIQAADPHLSTSERARWAGIAAKIRGDQIKAEATIKAASQTITHLSPLDGGELARRIAEAYAPATGAGAPAKPSPPSTGEDE